MPNEALEEILLIEAALPADLGRGRDFPTRDPTTGQWTGAARREQPTERQALAAVPQPLTTASFVLRPPSPRPATGPRRRMPGRTLPTIHEIWSDDGYQLGSPAHTPPSNPRQPPPVALPLRRLQQDQKQHQQEPGEEADVLTDSSSDYGQRPRVQGDTTNQRGWRAGLRSIFSAVRGMFSGLHRGSQRRDYRVDLLLSAPTPTEAAEINLGRNGRRRRRG